VRTRDTAAARLAVHALPAAPAGASRAAKVRTYDTFAARAFAG